MKAALLLAALSLALSASPAQSQGGLNLYWDDCSVSGTVLKTFACNSNTGPAFSLYASVVVPADMPQFAATTCIIDVILNGGSIPNWWQLSSGQCRANAVAMSFDPTVLTTSCEDLWAGNVPMSVFQVQPSPHGLPYELRLNGGAALPMGSEIHVPADGRELVISRLMIQRSKSTGAGACAGCIVGACLLLNEAYLQQPIPLPIYRVTNPAANTLVVWNDYYGGYFHCGGVWDVARNRTWGQVKGSYR